MTRPGSSSVDQLHVDPHVGGALVGAHAAVPGVLPGALRHVVVEPVELVADHVADERRRLVHRLPHRLPQPLEAAGDRLGDAVRQGLGRVLAQVRLDQLGQRRLVVGVEVAAADPLRQVAHRERGGGVERRRRPRGSPRCRWSGARPGSPCVSRRPGPGVVRRPCGHARRDCPWKSRCGLGSLRGGYSGCGHSTDRLERGRSAGGGAPTTSDAAAPPDHQTDLADGSGWRSTGSRLGLSARRLRPTSRTASRSASRVASSSATSSSLRARSASTWCSRSRIRRTPSMPAPDAVSSAIVRSRSTSRAE